MSIVILSRTNWIGGSEVLIKKRREARETTYLLAALCAVCIFQTFPVSQAEPYKRLASFEIIFCLQDKIKQQAGAELCQAQPS